MYLLITFDVIYLSPNSNPSTTTYRESALPFQACLKEALTCGAWATQRLTLTKKNIKKERTRCDGCLFFFKGFRSCVFLNFRLFWTVLKCNEYCYIQT